MNVSLSFNMFKSGGPMNIKWDSPFRYPNHALTLLYVQIDQNINEVLDIWWHAHNFTMHSPNLCLPNLNCLLQLVSLLNLFGELFF
jgi:hypothetical protein